MGDITHSAGGPICLPSSGVQQFVISELMFMFQLTDIFFSFACAGTSGFGGWLCSESAPSMQRTQRSRGLAVPDTARKAVPDTARKLRVILHYFHR